MDFRNKISHEYFGIEAAEIWNIIHDNLPEFKILIECTINSIDEELKQELVNSFIEDNKYLNFVVKYLEKIK